MGRARRDMLVCADQRCGLDATTSSEVLTIVLGIWTQLLLAYGVHKSLIFFRVPLTAAVTPRIVKWLRSRGWNIGRQNVK